ncbi:MAG: MASE1 domain-containing protein [Acidobacteriota bacterium]
MRETAGLLSADNLSGRRRSVRIEFLRAPSTSWVRVAGSVALFEATFYVAYRYGMSFTQSVPAPFWFPDTVLLCALLLTSPRLWWLFILAMAPIRFFVVPAAAPAWFVAAAFVNDSLKGLLAAALLRRALPNPVRFDRLRDFGVYVAIAVFGVPMLSAVGGGAAWRALGKEYWPAWQAWFLGDAMANLILTPAVLYWLFGYRDRRRGPRSGRVVEGLLLTGGLVALSLAAFSGRIPGPYDSLALLYGPVVFLMWAATRFGLKGASAALTLSAFLAAGAAAQGRGPFAAQPPEERILWIQLFLFAVALPLLFLSVLVRERDAAGASLRQSESRYRDIVNSQSDLICRYLPDTTLTFVNEAYCRYFGRSRGELIGRRFLDLIPEAAREAARQHVLSLVANPRVVTDEHEALRADGSIGWQQWVDYAIRGRDGRILEFQAVGRDVTDRKRDDDANHEMRHAGRVVLLGELTASIAHEINQPLGAIVSNADAAGMLLESGGQQLPEIREILSDIRQEGLRASEVIGRVRSLVGRRPMTMAALSLRAVATDVMRFADPEARRRGVAIDMCFDSGMPDVRGDRVSLQQVLLNLVLNGMEAMGDVPPGGRRLTLSATSLGDGRVEVAVSDCGHGIQPDLLPRLFDSFVTSRENGMGLGLSISRSIVEAHGGRIWAENNSGGGATVRFTLPADGTAGDEAPAEGTR